MIALLSGLCMVFGASSVADGATVAFAMSNEFARHVTVEERADHYLVHTDIQVSVSDEIPPDGKRLRVALITDGGGELVRQVQVTGSHDIWRFYFRVPKNADTSTLRVALVVKLEGSRDLKSAVFNIRDGQIDQGTAARPVSLESDAEVPITQEVKPGEFVVGIAKERRIIRNDYRNLPIVGFSSVGARLPETIDEEEMAQRLKDK